MSRLRRSLHLDVFIVAGLASACSTWNSLPPQVSVTEIQPSGRAAKGPNCDMPVLNADPTGKFQKVAIVEGWGSEGQDDQLVAEIRRRACETGADAVLIVLDRVQMKTHLVYDPANEEPGEEGNGSMAQNKGQEIDAKEHVARIGEPGHKGRYIDAYAIVLGGD